MKILILNDLYKCGGAELIAIKQLRLLSSCNEKVMMITFDPAFKDGFIEKDIYNIRTSSNKAVNVLNRASFSPSVYSRLRKMVTDFKPDIIFMHDMIRSPLAQFMAVRRYKCIQTVHDYFYICPKFNCILPDGSVCKGVKFKSCCKEGCVYDGSGLKLLFFRYLSFITEIVVKHSVDFFIAPSKRLGRILKAYGYKCLVIGNPYEVNFGTTQRTEERKTKFLYAGRISRDKGIFEFLNAFIKWNEPHEYEMIVAGSFATEEDRKRFEAMEDRYQWITYAGEKKHEEILEMMRHAEFAVVPSVGIENYPTTVLDAFSAGAIVLGSSRGGIKEMISDGRGIGFKVLDSADIIRKLDKACSFSATEKESIRERCGRYLKEYNSEEKYLKDILELAGSVVHK